MKAWLDPPLTREEKLILAPVLALGRPAALVAGYTFGCWVLGL